MGSFEDEVEATRCWMESERFAETRRLFTPRQVVEQRGTVQTDYPVARNAAERFYARLRELFGQRRSITTFGPYSPGQAVAMPPGACFITRSNRFRPFPAIRPESDAISADLNTPGNNPRRHVADPTPELR